MRADLIATIRRLADTPLEGYQRRRKGMTVETAQRVLAEVLGAVVALAEQHRLDRDWTSSGFLADLRRLCQANANAVNSSAVQKNGANHG